MVELVENQVSFDQLREGDEIDDSSTEETFFVLYDRYNSTIGNDAVIVEAFKDEVYDGQRTLKREDFIQKQMKAYRN